MTLAIIFGETKRNKKPPLRATNTGLRSCWFFPFLCLSSHSSQSGLLLVQLEDNKLSQWILWKCLLSRKKIFIWMLESNRWNSWRHKLSGKNSKHLFSLSRSFFDLLQFPPPACFFLSMKLDTIAYLNKRISFSLLRLFVRSVISSMFNTSSLFNM